MAAFVGVTTVLIWTALCQPAHGSDGYADILCVTVKLQESPPLVTFSFHQPIIYHWWTEVDGGANALVDKSGSLDRRALPSTGSAVTAPWVQIKAIPTGATSVTDPTIVPGIAYEYRIVVADATAKKMAYTATGIGIPMEEYRGKIVLVVDQTLATPCAAELARLQQDLVGDGWRVIRHDVPRDDGNYATRHQARSVKDLIVADYKADPANVKAVLLFGRVPVPYSGWTVPDGHYQRALPADGYYGDMEGTWTDTANLGTTDPRGSNVSGDGKFDQNTFPGHVDLMVGRVDLCNMPYFGDETLLLKRYLAKDHAWRNRRFTVDSSSMVSVSNPWNWGPFNTARQLTRDVYKFDGGSLWYKDFPVNADFMRIISYQSHLFAYIGNRGNYDNAGQIYSSDMAARNVRAVFMLEGGSYSVDWDVANAFMRSFPASSGYALCGGWSEFPGWHLHHLGAGAPLGLSARVMQNASCGERTSQDYWEFPAKSPVWLSLHGDPTLRMSYVAPPAQLTASASGRQAILNWTASSDPEVTGYHIYRANSITGAFTRLNANRVAGAAYTDATARATDVVYMVRALKLERSRTATYWNLSQGAFVPFRLNKTSNRLPTAHAQTLHGASPLAITLAGSDPDGDALTYVINETTVNGILSGHAPNLTYTPYNGACADRFTFTVHDAYGASAPVTVNLAIGPSVLTSVEWRAAASLMITTEARNIPVPEGRTASFRVKLSAAPSSNVTVTTAPTGGDADISVSSGGSLTFTPTNWKTDQTVTLAAAADVDRAHGQATIVCSAPGFASVTLNATETDLSTVLNVIARAGGTVAPVASPANIGEPIALTATPAAGYAFLNWTAVRGDVTFGNPNAASTTVTINQPYWAWDYTPLVSMQGNFVPIELRTSTSTVTAIRGAQGAGTRK